MGTDRADRLPRRDGRKHVQFLFTADPGTHTGSTTY